MSAIAVRGDLVIQVIEGRGLADKDTDLTTFFKDLSDPWVEVIIDGKQLLTTTTILNSLNPKWNARGIYPLCYREDFLKIKVWDDDYVGVALVGETTVSLQPVTTAWERNEWFPLNNKAGELLLSLAFTPFQSPSSTLAKEPLNMDSFYFSPRKGGNLQLYHDAHSNEIPPLGKRYTLNDKNHTFVDMTETFEKAKKFIYIAGWSIWTDLKLRRDIQAESLGDILKRKANEGVTVLVLIWNEKFSANLCKELAGTHDQKTLNFFSGSKVTVAAVRRMTEAESKSTEAAVETILSHHMKIIIADSPEKGLVGFIGGLDLTNGRWDTPEHPLWETLKSLHKDDFYNNFASVTKDTGPREPWHDVHARVEGPAVLDIKTIFEERWKKQVPKQVNRLVSFKEEDLSGLYPADLTDGRFLHTQALRSSDTDSSLFDPNAQGLSRLKIKRKDTSVQHGLIAMIRSCTKFIYIESQYFLGSAFMWETLKTTVASNLVPIEIAEQICHGIKTGNKIRVYVVMPMCPEGNPTTKVGACSMNHILHWQFLTIQMMFLRIAKTLKEVGSSDHPEDYLLFMCLGKKHKRGSPALSFPVIAKKGSEELKWQQRSRFLIYVHSKMAIVDDARVIVGSANFNQRSLSGSRDTESAIAASQVDFAGEERKIVTDGEVSQLRRCLWYEHTEGLSESDPVFSDPSSQECIAALRERSRQSLFDYATDSVDKDVTFRYLKYPLQVGIDGSITNYPNMVNMPDFPLSVRGNSGGFIPHTVTT